MQEVTAKEELKQIHALNKKNLKQKRHMKKLALKLIMMQWMHGMLWCGIGVNLEHGK